MKEFKEFLGKQGVVGLAVGFILGGAVSLMVASLVDDLINPIIAKIFSADQLAVETAEVAGVTFGWGNFVATFVNFVIIAAVVFYGVKWLKLDKLDK